MSTPPSTTATTTRTNPLLDSSSHHEVPQQNRNNNSQTNNNDNNNNTFNNTFGASSTGTNNLRSNSTSKLLASTTPKWSLPKHHNFHPNTDALASSQKIKQSAKSKQAPSLTIPQARETAAAATALRRMLQRNRNEAIKKKRQQQQQAENQNDRADDDDENNNNNNNRSKSRSPSSPSAVSNNNSSKKQQQQEQVALADALLSRKRNAFSIVSNIMKRTHQNTDDDDHNNNNNEDEDNDNEDDDTLNFQWKDFIDQTFEKGISKVSSMTRLFTISQSKASLARKNRSETENNDTSFNYDTEDEDEQHDKQQQSVLNQKYDNDNNDEDDEEEGDTPILLDMQQMVRNPADLAVAAVITKHCRDAPGGLVVDLGPKPSWSTVMPSAGERVVLNAAQNATIREIRGDVPRRTAEVVDRHNHAATTLSDSIQTFLQKMNLDFSAEEEIKKIEEEIRQEDRQIRRQQWLLFQKKVHLVDAEKRARVKLLHEERNVMDGIAQKHRLLGLKAMQRAEDREKRWRELVEDLEDEYEEERAELNEEESNTRNEVRAVEFAARISTLRRLRKIHLQIEEERGAVQSEQYRLRKMIWRDHNVAWRDLEKSCYEGAHAIVRKERAEQMKKEEEIRKEQERIKRIEEQQRRDQYFRDRLMHQESDARRSMEVSEVKKAWEKLMRDHHHGFAIAKEILDKRIADQKRDEQYNREQREVPRVSLKWNDATSNNLALVSVPSSTSSATNQNHTNKPSIVASFAAMNWKGVPSYVCKNNTEFNVRLPQTALLTSEQRDTKLEIVGGYIVVGVIPSKDTPNPFADVRKDDFVTILEECLDIESFCQPKPSMVLTRKASRAASTNLSSKRGSHASTSWNHSTTSAEPLTMGSSSVTSVPNSEEMNNNDHQHLQHRRRSSSAKLLTEGRDKFPEFMRTENAQSKRRQSLVAFAEAAKKEREEEQQQEEEERKRKLSSSSLTNGMSETGKDSNENSTSFKFSVEGAAASGGDDSTRKSFRKKNRIVKIRSFIEEEEEKDPAKKNNNEESENNTTPSVAGDDDQQQQQRYQQLAGRRRVSFGGVALVEEVDADKLQNIKSQAETNDIFSSSTASNHQGRPSSASLNNNTSMNNNNVGSPTSSRRPSSQLSTSPFADHIINSVRIISNDIYYGENVVAHFELVPEEPLEAATIPNSLYGPTGPLANIDMMSRSALGRSVTGANMMFGGSASFDASLTHQQQQQQRTTSSSSGDPNNNNNNQQPSITTNTSMSQSGIYSSTFTAGAGKKERRARGEKRDKNETREALLANAGPMTTFPSGSRLLLKLRLAEDGSCTMDVVRKLLAAIAVGNRTMMGYDATIDQEATFRLQTEVTLSFRERADPTTTPLSVVPKEEQLKRLEEEQLRRQQQQQQQQQRVSAFTPIKGSTPVGSRPGSGSITTTTRENTATDRTADSSTPPPMISLLGSSRNKEDENLPPRVAATSTTASNTNKTNDSKIITVTKSNFRDVHLVFPLISSPYCRGTKPASFIEDGPPIQVFPECAVLIRINPSLSPIAAASMLPPVNPSFVARLPAATAAGLQLGGTSAYGYEMVVSVDVYDPGDRIIIHDDRADMVTFTAGHDFVETTNNYHHHGHDDDDDDDEDDDIVTDYNEDSLVMLHDVGHRGGGGERRNSRMIVEQVDSESDNDNSHHNNNVDHDSHNSHNNSTMLRSLSRTSNHAHSASSTSYTGRAKIADLYHNSKKRNEWGEIIEDNDEKNNSENSPTVGHDDDDDGMNKSDHNGGDDNDNDPFMFSANSSMRSISSTTNHHYHSATTSATRIRSRSNSITSNSSVRRGSITNNNANSLSSSMRRRDRIPSVSASTGNSIRRKKSPNNKTSSTQVSTARRVNNSHAPPPQAHHHQNNKNKKQNKNNKNKQKQSTFVVTGEGPLQGKYAGRFGREILVDEKCIATVFGPLCGGSEIRSTIASRSHSTIKFSDNATLSHMKEVVERIKFIHTTLNPIDGDRTISIAVRSPQGEVSSISRQVIVQPVDDATELYLNTSDENPCVFRYRAEIQNKNLEKFLPPDEPSFIAPEAEVVDPDSEIFEGGFLEVEIIDGVSVGDTLYLTENPKEANENFGKFYRQEDPADQEQHNQQQGSGGAVRTNGKTSFASIKSKKQQTILVVGEEHEESCIVSIGQVDSKKIEVATLRKDSIKYRLQEGGDLFSSVADIGAPCISMVVDHHDANDNDENDENNNNKDKNSNIEQDSDDERMIQEHLAQEEEKQRRQRQQELEDQHQQQQQHSNSADGILPPTLEVTQPDDDDHNKNNSVTTAVAPLIEVEKDSDHDREDDSGDSPANQSGGGGVSGVSGGLLGAGSLSASGARKVSFRQIKATEATDYRHGRVLFRIELTRVSIDFLQALIRSIAFKNTERGRKGDRVVEFRLVAGDPYEDKPRKFDPFKPVLGRALVRVAEPLIQSPSSFVYKEGMGQMYFYNLQLFGADRDKQKEKEELVSARRGGAAAEKERQEKEQEVRGYGNGFISIKMLEGFTPDDRLYIRSLDETGVSTQECLLQDRVPAEWRELNEEDFTLVPEDDDEQEHESVTPPLSSQTNNDNNNAKSLNTSNNTTESDDRESTVSVATTARNNHNNNTARTKKFDLLRKIPSDVLVFARTICQSDDPFELASLDVASGYARKKCQVLPGCPLEPLLGEEYKNRFVGNLVPPGAIQQMIQQQQQQKEKESNSKTGSSKQQKEKDKNNKENQENNTTLQPITSGATATTTTNSASSFDFRAFVSGAGSDQQVIIANNNTNNSNSSNNTTNVSLTNNHPFASSSSASVLLYNNINNSYTAFPPPSAASPAESSGNTTLAGLYFMPPPQLQLHSIANLHNRIAILPPYGKQYVARYYDLQGKDKSYIGIVENLGSELRIQLRTHAKRVYKSKLPASSMRDGGALSMMMNKSVMNKSTTAMNKSTTAMNKSTTAMMNKSTTTTTAEDANNNNTNYQLLSLNHPYFSHRHSDIKNISMADIQSILRQMVFECRNVAKYPDNLRRVVLISVNDGRSKATTHIPVEINIQRFDEVTEVKRVAGAKELSDFRVGSQAAAVPVFADAYLDDPDTDEFNNGYVSVHLHQGMQDGDWLRTLTLEEQVSYRRSKVRSLKRAVGSHAARALTNAPTAMEEDDPFFLFDEEALLKSGPPPGVSITGTMSNASSAMSGGGGKGSKSSGSAATASPTGATAITSHGSQQNIPLKGNIETYSGPVYILIPFVVGQDDQDEDNNTNINNDQNQHLQQQQQIFTHPALHDFGWLFDSSNNEHQSGSASASSSSPKPDADDEDPQRTSSDIVDDPETDVLSDIAKDEQHQHSTSTSGAAAAGSGLYSYQQQPRKITRFSKHFIGTVKVFKNVNNGTIKLVIRMIDGEGVPKMTLKRTAALLRTIAFFNAGSKPLKARSGQRLFYCKVNPGGGAEDGRSKKTIAAWPGLLGVAETNLEKGGVPSISLKSGKEDQFPVSCFPLAKIFVTNDLTFKQGCLAIRLVSGMDWLNETLELEGVGKKGKAFLLKADKLYTPKGLLCGKLTTLTHPENNNCVVGYVVEFENSSRMSGHVVQYFLKTIVFKRLVPSQASSRRVFTISLNEGHRYMTSSVEVALDLDAGDRSFELEFPLPNYATNNNNSNNTNDNDNDTLTGASDTAATPPAISSSAQQQQQQQTSHQPLSCTVTRSQPSCKPFASCIASAATTTIQGNCLVEVEVSPFEGPNCLFCSNIETCSIPVQNFAGSILGHPSDFHFVPGKLYQHVPSGGLYFGDQLIGSTCPGHTNVVQPAALFTQNTASNTTLNINNNNSSFGNNLGSGSSSFALSPSQFIQQQIQQNLSQTGGMSGNPISQYAATTWASFVQKQQQQLVLESNNSNSNQQQAVTAADNNDSFTNTSLTPQAVVGFTADGAAAGGANIHHQGSDAKKIIASSTLVHVPLLTPQVTNLQLTSPLLSPSQQQVQPHGGGGGVSPGGAGRDHLSPDTINSGDSKENIIDIAQPAKAIQVEFFTGAPVEALEQFIHCITYLRATPQAIQQQQQQQQRERQHQLLTPTSQHHLGRSALRNSSVVPDSSFNTQAPTTPVGTTPKHQYLQQNPSSQNNVAGSSSSHLHHSFNPNQNDSSASNEAPVTKCQVKLSVVPLSTTGFASTVRHQAIVEYLSTNMFSLGTGFKGNSTIFSSSSWAGDESLFPSASVHYIPQRLSVYWGACISDMAKKFGSADEVAQFSDSNATKMTPSQFISISLTKFAGFDLDYEPEVKKALQATYVQQAKSTSTSKDQQQQDDNNNNNGGDNNNTSDSQQQQKQSPKQLEEKREKIKKSNKRCALYRDGVHFATIVRASDKCPGSLCNYAKRTLSSSDLPPDCWPGPDSPFDVDLDDDENNDAELKEGNQLLKNDDLLLKYEIDDRSIMTNSSPNSPGATLPSSLFLDQTAQPQAVATSSFEEAVARNDDSPIPARNQNNNNNNNNNEDEEDEISPEEARRRRVLEQKRQFIQTKIREKKQKLSKIQQNQPQRLCFFELEFPFLNQDKKPKAAVMQRFLQSLTIISSNTTSTSKESKESKQSNFPHHKLWIEAVLPGSATMNRVTSGFTIDLFSNNHPQDLLDAVKKYQKMVSGGGGGGLLSITTNFDGNSHNSSATPSNQHTPHSKNLAMIRPTKPPSGSGSGASARPTAQRGSDFRKR